MERVVITGYGVVSPVGCEVADFFNNIVAGKNGIGPITAFDASETGVTLAAEVKDFPFERYFQKKDAKRMDRFSLFGVYAANEALKDSGLKMEEVNPDRVGVIVGSGVGGLQTIQDQVIKMHEKGPNRVAPLFVPMTIVNMAAGNIALSIGAKGTCEAIVTACASGTHSIGEAFRSIKHGYQDVIFAGGAEASINQIGVAGFNNLTALSRNTDANSASIPFDEKRNGFVMGEGAGIVVVESLSHAQKRGAKILAEVVGFGSTCDAYHMTAPDAQGTGAKKAMRQAIEEAGIAPGAVQYINAHGTSTKANDAAESLAIAEVFGSTPYVSSTKSMTGHLLGAAGGVEAIITIESLRQQVIPATINTDEPMAVPFHLVVGKSQPANLQYAISNSLGFGGHNGVVAFKRWED